MRVLTEFRRYPITLSPTVVRNILSEVRSHPNRDSAFVQNFDFRHGRYYVTAFCRFSRCTELVVCLHHRYFCETWVIKPDDYLLLPSEAFDL